MIDQSLVEKMLPGHLFQHYLLSSYCYYALDQSPLTDVAYDRLTVRLLECFDTTEHPHKGFVNKEDLKAGTCLLYWSDYPKIVILGAGRYLEDCLNFNIHKNIELYLDSIK